jgi:diguanylate cyclase (GGDEF)-like protein
VTDPLRIVVLGPIPDAVREALRRLPGGAVLADHPDPRGALAALGTGEASLAVRAALDPGGETLRGLLIRECARAERYGHTLALVRLDVDRLGELERTFGEEAVAAFLASLEESLRRSLRRVDVLVRAGRGSFAAILPETSEAGGGIAAERLRDLTSRLMGKPAAPSAGPPLPFRSTASVGVACFSAPGAEDPDTLLSAAETALAGAEREGGNRVRVAGPAPE